MSEDDKITMAVFLGLIFLAILIHFLLGEVSLQGDIMQGKNIILNDSSYKCKMINTLKELQDDV